MKNFYLILTLLFTAIALAQEPKASGDIDGFTLFPNPVTNGKVYVNTAENAPKTVLIFDVLGTQVLQRKLIGSELSLSDLDAGVYILRVIEKDKVATRKLIIK